MGFERHEAREVAYAAWVLDNRFTDCLGMVMFFSNLQILLYSVFRV